MWTRIGLRRAPSMRDRRTRKDSAWRPSTGTSISSRRSRTCKASNLALLGPKVRIRYRPVLFAGLLGAQRAEGSGRDRAASACSPTASWSGRRNGSASRSRCRHEHPFNPLPLLRLAIACDCSPEAVHRIFRFVWRDGRLPDLPIEWAELVARPAAARRAAPHRGAGSEGRASPQHRRGDRARRVRRADAHGRRRAVLGRGRDRDGRGLHRGGQRWTDPEYERVAALPVGAVRREADTRRREAGEESARRFTAAPRFRLRRESRAPSCTARAVASAASSDVAEARDVPHLARRAAARALPYRCSLAAGWRSTSRHAGSRGVVRRAVRTTGRPAGSPSPPACAGACRRAADRRARAPAARTAT